MAQAKVQLLDRSNTERRSISVNMSLMRTMLAVCAKTAITRKAGLRWPNYVNTKIESYMHGVCAKRAILETTTIDCA